MTKLREEYFAAFFSADDFGSFPPSFSFGIVTACNPNGELATEERNREADWELKAYLQAAGLPHFRVTGGSKDGLHRELGFGIPTVNPETIRRIACRFQQEAFFWVVDGWIYVTHVNGPDLHPVGRWQDRQMKQQTITPGQLKEAHEQGR